MARGGGLIVTKEQLWHLVWGLIFIVLLELIVILGIIIEDRFMLVSMNSLEREAVMVLCNGSMCLSE